MVSTFEPPAPAHTHLVRACVLPDSAGRRAWAEFAAAVGDPLEFFATARDEIKGIVPQLLAGLRRNGVAVDARLGAHFKAAYVHEEIRFGAYSRALAEALAELRRRRIAFVLVSGSATAHTVYDPPFVRHSHDIEILVGPSQLRAACDALVAAGWASGADCAEALNGVRLVHRNALGLQLRTRFTGMVGPDRLVASAWRERRCIDLAGCSTPVLAAADALVEAVGRALWRSGEADPLWACDAWRLLARADDLCWNRVLAWARSFAAGAAMRGALEYLADALDAAVPPTMRKALGRLVPADGRDGTSDDDGAIDSAIAAACPQAGLPVVAQGCDLTPGDTITFGIDGNARKYASFGWSGAERAWTWTVGRAAQLVFRVPPARGRRLALAFRVQPCVAASHPTMDVDVLANGRLVAQWSFAFAAANETERRIVIEDGPMHEDLMRLEFRIAHPFSPARAGLSSDHRELGLMFEEARISWCR